MRTFLGCRTLLHRQKHPFSCFFAFSKFGWKNIKLSIQSSCNSNKFWDPLKIRITWVLLYIQNNHCAASYWVKRRMVSAYWRYIYLWLTFAFVSAGSDFHPYWLVCLILKNMPIIIHRRDCAILCVHPSLYVSILSVTKCWQREMDLQW